MYSMNYIQLHMSHILLMLCPGYEGGGPRGGGGCILYGVVMKLGGVGWMIPPGAMGQGTWPSNVRK